MDDLFKLTEDQRKSFDRLKKAHADCLKTGIFFYNNYGTLGALDSNKIKNYDDDGNSTAIENNNQNCLNELYLNCGEWADDTHYFHPISELNLK